MALTIAMLPWNPTRGCGPPTTPPPIIAFELATDHAALADLFGAPGQCRDQLVADLRIVNLIDYLFMVAYGAMLFAALRTLGAPRWLLTAAVIAPLADAVENLALFRIDLDAPSSWFAVLAVASRTKFVLIGVVSWAIAAATWRAGTPRRRWLALAHVPAMPAVVAGCFVPAMAPAMVPAIALSWLAVLVS